MNHIEETLSLQQQIRRISAENNTVGFRIWKSRMKALKLKATKEEYIKNGYLLIRKERKQNDTKVEA